MNKIFKVVFNKSTGNMEVRSEIDNNQGKTSESRKSNKLTAISLSLMLAAPTVSYAANDTSELTNTSAVYQFLNESDNNKISGNISEAIFDGAYNNIVKADTLPSKKVRIFNSYDNNIENLIDHTNNADYALVENSSFNTVKNSDLESLKLTSSTNNTIDASQYTIKLDNSHFNTITKSNVDSNSSEKGLLLNSSNFNTIDNTNNLVNLSI